MLFVIKNHQREEKIMNLLGKALFVFAMFLCVVTQSRAAEMWRNLEDLNGFDGYISSATPDSFTDNEMLLVSYYDATRWSFVRFNVSTLPEVSQVQNVKLWLWTEYPGINTPSRAMYMYPLYVPFSSSTTWNNRNVSVYAGASDVLAGSVNGWTVIDITQYYQKWRSGQWVNHGIILIPNQAQSVLNWFASANYITAAAKKPRIQVTYTGLVTPPSVQFLSFPLPSSLYPQGAYTAGKVTSVVDHQMTNVYGFDGTVLAFNGEKGVGTPVNQGCYQKPGGGSFSIAGTYVGGGGCPVTRLNYDGHPGYDYYAVIGTEVRAAAYGRVVNFNSSICIPKGISGGCTAWGAVGIDHGNGYVTQYLHLSAVNTRITAGAEVQAGEVIGFSGNKAPTGITIGAHLHFEVLKRTATSTPDNVNNYKVVDPYGWTGSGSDPLQNITQVQNIRLWR